MIKIFKTFGGYVEIQEPQKNCWINTTNPTQKEIQKLTEIFGLPGDIIYDILDQDERPRIEFEENWTLIILRIPVEVKNNGLPFYTLPLGIFITDNFTLTLISIILMIPTLIASIFGMNVPNFMENSMWALPSIILGSLLLTISGVILFRKRQWF